MDYEQSDFIVHKVLVKMSESLKYVYENTCIDSSGEWTFKPVYDP